MINNNRNKYIDIIKGVLIIFVVIGHLPFFEYNSRTLTLIYSFHMPAFLIIGGILSKITENSNPITIITKKIKSCLVPYYVFYLISFIIIPIETSTQKNLAIIAMLNGLGVPPGAAINLPLWFLTFYFCSMTIFELIECLSYKISYKLFNNDNNKKLFFAELFSLIIIIIIMILSFIYSKIYRGPRLPYNFEISMFCLGFIYFGHIIKLNRSSLNIHTITNYIKTNTKKFPLFNFLIIFILILILILWYFVSMNNGRIDLNARDYKNAFLMYFNAILGFIILSFFSYIIFFISIINIILSYLGENSLYILAYHIPSTIITHNIIVPLLPGTIATMITHNSIFSILFLTSLGITISLFFSLIHKVGKHST